MSMQALEFNITTIVAQIINFAILFLVLRKFVFDSVLKIINQQKNKIKDAETKSQQINQELAALAQKKKESLDQTQKEALVLLDQAKQEAINQKKDLLDQTKKEASAILKEAKMEIKHQEKEIKESLKDTAADLAVKIASKLIAQSLGQKEQRLLVKKSLLSFKKTEL